ncbi:hypothetical protein [Parasphingorhabdus sp.]|uniref:hypothetical protein n=1 Tax=Parasphingorhabdus sp. TaxID=2709688 RepID=UPI003A920F45
MAATESEGCLDDRRKLRFLKCLATSSHVSASAEAAHISLSTLYHWRTRDPEFRRRWMQALAAGYEMLEMELLDRARNGVKKHIFRNGEPVATVREHNDGIAVKLLLAHKQMVALTRAAEEEMSAEQVRASLDRKLGNMRAKLLRRRALAEQQNGPLATAADE